MYEGKPIIGLAGGIGAGKSHVARALGKLGGAVIASDALVAAAYTHPAVKRQLHDWYGDAIFDGLGRVDKRAVAGRVFADAGQRERLEKLLHPIVNEARLELMRRAAGDPAVAAYVWDSPLLYETGLDARCDAVIFVDAPRDVRVERVMRTRGWDAAELDRRERVQTPLDEKRERATHVIDNGGAGGDGGGAGPLATRLRAVVESVTSAGPSVAEVAGDAPG